MPECYLCGAEATTEDHVPPQGLFSKVPANIIKLPACKTCNCGASLDEEYMRTVLAAMGYAVSFSARDVWEGPIRHSFERRPKGLRARLASALRFLKVSGAEHATVPALEIEGDRAHRVFQKIARGLYFNYEGKRLADDELLLFRDDGKIDFRTQTTGWPEIDMGDVFRCRFQRDDQGSIIWFEFYRNHWWFALTGEHAKTYPHR